MEGKKMTLIKPSESGLWLNAEWGVETGPRLLSPLPADCPPEEEGAKCSAEGRVVSPQERPGGGSVLMGRCDPRNGSP